MKQRLSLQFENLVSSVPPLWRPSSLPTALAPLQMFLRIRHGAWLHAIALAAVLDIKLSGQEEVMAGYSQHKICSHMADPILLMAGASVFNADCDWHDAKAQLQAAGNVTLHRSQLDTQGYGSFALI